MPVCDVSTASKGLPPTGLLTKEPARQDDTNRVFYSERKYGCAENFESSQDFARYIEQIENDFKAIAKNINADRSSEEAIRLFCQNFHQCQNVRNELKPFLYAGLGESLMGFRQLNFDVFFAHKIYIQRMLNNIILNLENNVEQALSDIIQINEIINVPSGKNISQHINAHIEKTAHDVIIKHVQQYHATIDRDEQELYVDAYKQHLKKANWIYPLQCKNERLRADIDSITKEHFYIMLAKLNQATNIITMIKDIGDGIRQNVERIFNMPGNYADVGDMRYLTERGHQEILQFTQSTSLPVDLTAILGRNVANNHNIYLLEYSGAIYGGLAEALVAENNEGNAYNIQSKRISYSSTIKSFKGLFWVDHGQYRDSVTLQALHMGRINCRIQDDLLRDAITYSPEESLLEYYHSNWCGDVGKVFNDFFNKNIYLLSIAYVKKDLMKIEDFKDKNGNTLLHAMIHHDDKVAYNGLKDKLSLLINEKNNSGTTSLMLAAAKGWATVVMDLLEHEEIHFDATDKNGHTALKIAVDNKHDTVIQIFESYKITFDNLKKKSAITKDYLSDANVPSGVPPKWRRVS